MICEIDGTRSFFLDDGALLDGKFDSGAPILACGSFRLCGQVSRFLFNELGLHCSQHCNKDDNCPYVLVLRPRTAHGKVKATDIKTARAVAKAMAVGLESLYLYKLDPQGN